jgi:protein-S-isoprenylcysteine O-methyltransferase Ste14
MTESKTYSYLLVVVQLVTAIAIIYLGAHILTLLPLILISTGIIIGVLGIFTMHLGNFNIIPIPKKDAELVTTGIYRYIRNPMYTGVLLICLGFAMNGNTILVWALWCVLLADLIVKLLYEEKLLAKHFPDYANYKARTKRLVPFIW